MTQDSMVALLESGWHGNTRLLLMSSRLSGNRSGHRRRLHGIEGPIGSWVLAPNVGVVLSREGVLDVYGAERNSGSPGWWTVIFC